MEGSLSMALSGRGGLPEEELVADLARGGRLSRQEHDLLPMGWRPHSGSRSRREAP